MTKLNRIKMVIMDNIVDVDSLVMLLELTVEDILDRHPNAILDNAHKFGDFDDDEEGEVEEETYLEEWDYD